MASVALVGLMSAGQLWAFNLDDVAAKAKDLAGQKYEAPKSNLPAVFRDMKFADYQKIHFLQERPSGPRTRPRSSCRSITRACTSIPR